MNALAENTAVAAPRQQLGPALQQLGRAAVAALHDELVLEPKPGLVSLIDSGSHDDMDAGTLMRSLFALRHAYGRLVALGAAGAGFEALAAAGRAAEVRMLRATGGINTHRGAIFSLGLLCASGGALLVRQTPLHPQALRQMLLQRWGTALAAHEAGAALSQPGAFEFAQAAASNGRAAAFAHGLRGAHAEAADGFPVLFETTLPALQAGLARGWTPRQARVQALFATMAVLADTNLAHRGGLAGLKFAQGAARDWLQAGGAGRSDAFDAARVLHREFIRRRLSPGGSADLLAAACWVQRVRAPAPGAGASL